MSFVKLITSISVVLLIRTPPTSCGFLYALEKNGKISKVDTITKEVTLDICDLPGKYVALAYDCVNMKMYAAEDDENIHELDIPSCTRGPSAVTNSGSHYKALAFVYSDMYGWNVDYSGIRQLDPVTGNDDTIISGDPLPMNDFTGMAYDIYTNTMYGATGENDVSWLVTFNLDTGVPYFIDSTGITDIGALEFGNNGGLFAGTDHADGGDIVTIDTDTGEATHFVTLNAGSAIRGLAYVSDDGSCVTKAPTSYPTNVPTINTKTPTLNPTISPTNNPTISPTNNPTNNPTTNNPTSITKAPTSNPTEDSGSDDDPCALFAMNKEYEENDVLENDGNVYCVGKMDSGILYHFSAMMIVFWAVNMGFYIFGKRQ
eukprot:855571_1